MLVSVTRAGPFRSNVKMKFPSWNIFHNKTPILPNQLPLLRWGWRAWIPGKIKGETLQRRPNSGVQSDNGFENRHQHWLTSEVNTLELQTLQPGAKGPRYPTFPT